MRRVARPVAIDLIVRRAPADRKISHIVTDRHCRPFVDERNRATLPFDHIAFHPSESAISRCMRKLRGVRRIWRIIDFNPVIWESKLMALHSRFSEAVGLLGWFAVVFAAAAVGALASIEARAFYAQLVQPSWAPPGYVFGPVWSVLYALMGVSAGMIWRQRHEKNAASC